MKVLHERVGIISVFLSFLLRCVCLWPCRRGDESRTLLQLHPAPPHDRSTDKQMSIRPPPPPFLLRRDDLVLSAVVSSLQRTDFFPGIVYFRSKSRNSAHVLL